MESSIAQDREGRLDALRGIAALSVAAAHCVTAFSGDNIYSNTFTNLNYGSRTAIFLRFLYIIFNADAAVIIFFVLSGYVLTKSLSRINYDLLTEFIVFLVKRIYRIIPTVVVSFMPVAYFIDKSAREYISNMLLLKVSINGATWTLQVEMMASFLIFLVFIVNKRGKFLSVPLFILLMVLFFTGYQPLFFKHFPAFFLGCYVGEIRKVLIGREKFLAPIATVFLLIADFFLGYGERSTIVVITLASVVIIACAPSSHFFRFLDHKIFGFLGKISFSFYLYHLTGALIILGASEVFGIHLGEMHRVNSVILYMITTIPLAVVLATISYHHIEKPSVAAGAEVNRAITRFVPSLFGTGETSVAHK